MFGAVLRKVAIIITRHGIDENGKKLANGILRESGKLIIVLDDNDVKEMLRLMLCKCKELGIDKVLLTCDKENVAYAKIIIHNGGVLENEV